MRWRDEGGCDGSDSMKSLEAEQMEGTGKGPGDLKGKTKIGEGRGVECKYLSKDWRYIPRTA